MNWRPILAIAVFLLGWIWLILSGNGTLQEFLRIKELVLVVIVPLIYVWLVYPKYYLKSIWHAAFTCQEVNKDELLCALKWIGSVQVMTLAMGILTFFTDIVIVMNSLDDPKTFGPRMVGVYLSLVYAVVFSMGILYAIRVSCLSKYSAVEVNDESGRLSLILLGILVIAVMLSMYINCLIISSAPSLTS